MNGSQRMPRWVVPVILLALTLTMAAITGLVWISRTAVLPRYGATPSFQLTDQDGRSFDSDAVTGRPLIVSFIYTQCPDICPVVTAKLRDVQAELSRAGSDALFLSISVDPEVDTPAVLKAFAERHGVDLSNWRFLTGDPSAVRAVVTDAFKTPMEKHHGQVIHSGRVVLVDRAGQVRAYFEEAQLEPGEVLKAFRAME